MGWTETGFWRYHLSMASRQTFGERALRTTYTAGLPQPQPQFWNGISSLGGGQTPVHVITVSRTPTGIRVSEEVVWE